MSLGLFAPKMDAMMTSEEPECLWKKTWEGLPSGYHPCVKPGDFQVFHETDDQRLTGDNSIWSQCRTGEPPPLSQYSLGLVHTAVGQPLRHRWPQWKTACCRLLSVLLVVPNLVFNFHPFPVDFQIFCLSHACRLPSPGRANSWRTQSCWPRWNKNYPDDASIDFWDQKRQMTWLCNLDDRN